jgi:hypothetical protein
MSQDYCADSKVWKTSRDRSLLLVWCWPTETRASLNSETGYTLSHSTSPFLWCFFFEIRSPELVSSPGLEP